VRRAGQQHELRVLHLQIDELTAASPRLYIQR
jgi:hypothetical protein